MFDIKTCVTDLAVFGIISKIELNQNNNKI